MLVFRVAMLSTLVSLAAGVPAAAAQTSDGRVSVAAHVTWLHLHDLDATSVGIGGRVTVDVTRWLGLDADLSVYPNDDFSLGNFGLIYRRRRIDGFAGVLAGVRRDRVGAFAKVRPGFTHLTDRGIDCGGDVCAFVLIAPPNYGTEFALDWGGVVEFYPSARTVARVDAGDVMIWHRAYTPPCTNCTTHNFSTKIGFGVKF